MCVIVTRIVCSVMCMIVTCIVWHCCMFSSSWTQENGEAFFRWSGRRCRMPFDHANMGKRKVTPGQESSDEDRSVHRQHELRMKAVLERRSKHDEDMRTARGKAPLRATPLPPKPRKVLYVSEDSSSEEERQPTCTLPVQEDDSDDR